MIGAPTAAPVVPKQMTNVGEERHDPCPSSALSGFHPTNLRGLKPGQRWLLESVDCEHSSGDSGFD